MAYLLDETASTASNDSYNEDRVDLGSLPTSGMRAFFSHMHTYCSASLKQNMDIA